MKPLQTVIGLLNTILIVLAGISLLALVALAVVNVFHKFVGAYELMGYAGAVVVAAALGETQISKDHVPVDIITRRFPSLVNRLIDLFKYLLKFAFAATVAWYMLDYALLIRRSGEVSPDLKITFYPFILCVATGFAVLACTVILDIARTLLPAPAPSPAAADSIQADQPAQEEVPLP